MVEQYGNNFYLLFEAMRTKESIPNNALVRVYLDPAEKLEAWENFIRSNQDLINSIHILQEEYRSYGPIFKEWKELLREKKWDEADELCSKNNMDQVSLLHWGKLNILLEKVGKIMDDFGIDQRQFFS